MKTPHTSNPHGDHLYVVKPRAVQIVEHEVPTAVRHMLEYKAWVAELKQGVTDHVKAIHISGEDGESYVSAHWEMMRNGHTDMKSDAVGHFNFATKQSDDGDGSVMQQSVAPSPTAAVKAELMARVHAADDVAVPPLGPDRASVEPDDVDGIQKFKLWLQHGVDAVDVKTDEVDGVTTFFLFNKSGQYLGYYSYEAGGSYGDQPAPQQELETLLEPKAQADLEDSSVQALVDYIDSHYEE